MIKKKILYVVPSLSKANGISTFCINYLKQIDLNKYKIDFLVMTEQPKDYFEFVKSMNCDIFEIKFNKRNIFGKLKALKEIETILKNNEYDIIHCHAPNFGVITQFFARKYGIKKRIIHSHAITSSARLINRIRNDIIEPFAIKNSNIFLACSNEAGSARFGKKEFTIINNSLNKNDYYYDIELRTKIRKELNILDEEIVIGTVGRLSRDKNQKFLIDILKELKKKVGNYKLLIVGRGPEEDNLKKYSEECSLQDSVIFTGVRNDVNSIYNAIDIFLLPSFAEGLGLVLIEAQMTGLKCLASKGRVPEKTKFTELIDFISIEEGTKAWVDYIEEINLNTTRKTMIGEFEKSDFNIDSQIKELEKIYDEG